MHAGARTVPAPRAQLRGTELLLASTGGPGVRVARGSPLQRCWRFGVQGELRPAQDRCKLKDRICRQILKGSWTGQESVGNRFRLLLPAAEAAAQLLEPCGWAATGVLMAAHVRSTGGRGSSGGPCPSPRSQLPPGSSGQIRPLCVSVFSVKSQNKRKKLIVAPNAREGCAPLSDGPSRDPRRQGLRRNSGRPGGCPSP